MTEPTEAREALADYVRSRAELARAAELPAPVERRRIREAAGVSLQQVAGELGVSATAISYWERGEWTPTLENALAYRQLLEQLADAAGVEIAGAS